MFWRKKNKGRKWRQPDGACVSVEKGGSHFDLLFFRTSRSRQTSKGQSPLLSMQHLEMATGRGEGWRPTGTPPLSGESG